MRLKSPQSEHFLSVEEGRRTQWSIEALNVQCAAPTMGQILFPVAFLVFVVLTLRSAAPIQGSSLSVCCFWRGNQLTTLLWFNNMHHFPQKSLTYMMIIGWGFVCQTKMDRFCCFERTKEAFMH